MHLEGILVGFILNSTSGSLNYRLQGARGCMSLEDGWLTLPNSAPAKPLARRLPLPLQPSAATRRSRSPLGCPSQPQHRRPRHFAYPPRETGSVYGVRDGVIPNRPHVVLDICSMMSSVVGIVFVERDIWAVGGDTLGGLLPCPVERLRSRAERPQFFQAHWDFLAFVAFFLATPFPVAPVWLRRRVGLLMYPEPSHHRNGP